MTFGQRSTILRRTLSGGPLEHAGEMGRIVKTEIVSYFTYISIRGGQMMLCRRNQMERDQILWGSTCLLTYKVAEISRSKIDLIGKICHVGQHILWLFEVRFQLLLKSAYNT